jgi:sialic acid synthase SpsE/mannose-6-phosphate isomerase-like protein (cupin superfamily)
MESLFMKKIPENLFTLEMANNHMGDLEHGFEVIKAFGKVCKKYPFSFAFKLQYRQLDSFIHPDMQDRNDVPYIKRFSETRLTRKDHDALVEEIRRQGFLTMSTPFDEESVDIIESQNLDIIKIPSCSFGDWPLLERISQTDKPIIASTAGASIEVMDQVISFLKHRNKEFAILHCVGEYPTPDENMHISQINFLRNRFPDVRIGFSTHEDTSNTDFIKMAIAKGATIFEKHVALKTKKYSINKYSATPEQVDLWLESALYAQKVCGEGFLRSPTNVKEAQSLQSLRRGVFAKKNIKIGDILTDDNVFFAFPPKDGQYTANDWSKYYSFQAKEDISINDAITPDNSIKKDSREKIWEIVKKTRILLKESNVVIPGSAELEISHHYGLEKFYEFGLIMLTVINRDYCKKLLVSLPGQKHPEQYHKQKEETFHVLYGSVDLELDGQVQTCRPGDVITIEPETRHAFVSMNGAVIEEISSTHYKNDSFYTDEKIAANKQRKTLLTHWMG